MTASPGSAIPGSAIPVTAGPETAIAVEIYLTQWCPYCLRARSLLQSKHVRPLEIDIEVQPERRSEMVTRSGRRTVPQIFIGGRHIGGSDDLYALEAAGRLDPLLTSH